MKKTLLFCLGLFVGLSGLYAQQTVSGKVTDASDGSALPGVSIQIRGTSTGATSDMDGNYSVSASSTDVLVFSFIGYENQEITVGSRTSINVQLATDVTELDELVVVGYGTQSRKEVTSAVTTVSAEEFNQGNVNNAAQLLQGKVPGLMIVRPGSNINGDFKVRLRGLATVGPNSSPLIIIDGVPSNSLDQLDPSDIENIDVLKDGAAAAIYGTRGSNGVIIVTTKTGSAGKANINYNGYLATESPTKFVDMLDAAGYRANGGPNDFGADTNWFEEITQTANSMTHNLSMTGGTEKTTYRVSVNYRDQSGILRLTGSNQLNTRVNVRQKAINDKLTITGNMSMTRKNSQLGFDQAFRYATIYNPTEPVRVDTDLNTPQGPLLAADYERWDGYYQNVQFDYYNPVSIIEQNINEETERLLNFHVKGDFEVIEGLNFDMAYSQQTENTLGGYYVDKQSFWGNGASRNGYAARGTENDFIKIFESTARFDKDFDNINIKALGGYSWQENVEEGFGTGGGGFVSDRFTYNNLGASLDYANGLANVGSGKSRSNLISFFGRLNFSYDDTYYAMVSYRTDGYSGFGANNKWGGFPAASAGVTLSNLMDVSAIDNLKFRISYGTTGTLPPRLYASIARMGPVGNAFVNGSFQPAYGPNSNDNPDLKWETKKEFNVGIDFGFLNYKLNGSMDFYSKTTSDLLLDFDVPVPPNLYNTTLLNIGELNNTGFELGLKYQVFENSNSSFETGLNFSTFRTTLLSLSNDQVAYGDGGQKLITGLGAPGQNGTFLTLVKEGDRIGNLFGPVHSDDPVNEAGEWSIEDTNGDGDIDTKDHQVIGNGLPDFQLGWTGTVKYGNFDANVFLRGVFGHDLLNTFRAFYENPNLIGSYNIMASSFNPELEGLQGSVNIYGSYHIEDASYLKLDNMSVGYNIDVSNLDWANKLRLYITGQNLFVITKYSGVDPEVRPDDNDNVLSPGIDRRDTWFRTRTYSFGVQLGF